MPFVNKEHRQTPDLAIPGDRCYIQYNKIMCFWKDNPRWTTVDQIVFRLFPDLSAVDRAKFLAFLVFFNFHVMPYEEQKRKENGDV